jgi:hypothetical protein
VREEIANDLDAATSVSNDVAVDQLPRDRVACGLACNEDEIAGDDRVRVGPVRLRNVATAEAAVLDTRALIHTEASYDPYTTHRDDSNC